MRRVKQTEPNPVAVRCEAWVLNAGITDSNPAESMNVRLVFFVCGVGSGLFDGLITRSEESHWVCVCVCVSNYV